ncbi:MAG: M50 family metallopeptidase [Candidatus Shapirobacteria bacterium]
MIFIIALSVLVLVHEFGHYIAAKLNGVRVDEFGLGLPPRIVGKNKWGTLWSLNWLPIGGFCKMYGEDPSEKGAGTAKDSFLTKKPTQKAIIVVGGVLMNLVLAVVIFAVSYTISGIPVESGRVKILEVAKDSPAEKAGLREGEIILKIGDKDLTKGEDLTQEVGKNKGKEIELLINREGQDTVLSVQIREVAPEGQGLMGVVVSSMEVKKIEWYQFYKGIGAGFKEAYFWGGTIAKGVWSMVTGLFVGQIPKDVTGPIGMFKATEQIRSQEGLLAVIHFFGIISVNLAIVNILPLPALDGGRILFVIYELLTGKRANEKFETIVNSIGMMILLGLILLITVGDVKNLMLKK